MNIDDPLAVAVAATEARMLAERNILAVRDPAIWRLCREGTVEFPGRQPAPRVSSWLWSALLADGFTVQEIRQQGVGPDNVRRIARSSFG